MRLADLEAALVKAHQAGDAAGARVIAQEVVKKRRSLGMQDDGTYAVPNPADTGSPFLAGVGKAFVDVGRGVGQMVGLVSRDDIAEARRLDAPLMQTGAGQVGNIVGSAAALAPTAFIPGANTMAGAALIGAGAGLAAPSVSTQETLQNTILGGGLGAGGLAAGRALASGAQGARALVEPFTQSGQERIAARAIQSFASNPTQTAQNLRGARPLVRGSRPTAAEVANDAGIAQLQRSIVNADPQIAAAFAERFAANNEARRAALGRIAGDDGQRELFAEMRDTVANQMYGKAFRKQIPEKKWAQVADDVAELMRRPAMQEAQTRAQRIAAQEGIELSEDGSVRGLHYMKKALDDMLDSAPQTGIGNVEKRAIAGTRDQLIGIIDKLSPDYAKARAEYADFSKKIAQMDVGQSLKDKAFPAMWDFGGNTRTRAGQFAEAVRNADAVAQKATGFRGATFENTMTPLQQKRVRQVAEDMTRKVQADEMGRAVGSNTAQNLVSQNLLRQILGPTGLPQSWAESALLETAVRPMQWIARAGEQRVVPTIADALLDPRETARLLQLAQRRGLLERSAPDIARYLPAAGLLALPAE